MEMGTWEVTYSLQAHPKNRFVAQKAHWTCLQNYVRSFDGPIPDICFTKDWMLWDDPMKGFLFFLFFFF